MSDNENEDTDIRVRHRRELKIFQQEVQKLKKTVTQGDKKQKKIVDAEIERKEKEIALRHKLELESEVNSKAADAEEKSEVKIASLSNAFYRAVQVDSPVPAALRQQKEEKRKAKRLALLQSSENESKSSSIDYGKLEKKQFENNLRPLGLHIYDIRPNGDCLFNAVLHQLGEYTETMPSLEEDTHDDFNNEEYSDGETDIASNSTNDINPHTEDPLNAALLLRKDVTDFLLHHKDEFLPFMSHENDTPFTDNDYEKYLHDMTYNKAWGGHCELEALSRILSRPIHVFRSDGTCTKIGEYFKDDSPLLLSYHAHAFGLGEHYNSLISQE